MFTQGLHIVHLLRWKKIVYLSGKDTIESRKKIPNPGNRYWNYSSWWITLGVLDEYLVSTIIML